MSEPDQKTQQGTGLQCTVLTHGTIAGPEVCKFGECDPSWCCAIGINVTQSDA